MVLGTLASIWRYPVKSLRGESLAAADVEADGIHGDRSGALIVESGHARLGKTYRGKENNRLHLHDDAAAAMNLASAGGVTVRAEDGDRYFDDAPVSIIIDRWLEALSAHVGYDVGPERFRPNFFVRAPRTFALDEDDLTGRELILGEVMLRVRYPIERCVTTTYDQTTGESDPEILSFVAMNRSTWMGIYCDVLRAGTARIGDSLAVAER